MDVTKLQVGTDQESGLKIINERYLVKKGIGQGLSGKVLLGEDKVNHNLVAIKTINRVDKAKLMTKNYVSQSSKIKSEISIMKRCNHPNVVKLYQVIDDLKYDKILLILEHCKYRNIDWKQYDHYAEKSRSKNKLTINKILRDVVNGLDYLHNYKGIIHRDLKPSNLLVDQEFNVKISDFGVSLILENNANDDKELGKSMGTPAFFAPELCQFVNDRLSMVSELDNESMRIDSRIDLWSLGVVLYCLAFHTLPFDGQNEYDLFQKIVNQPLKFPNTRASSRATDQDLEEVELLKVIISKLLEKNPRQRLSIQHIKQHSFTTLDFSEKEREKFLKYNDQFTHESKGITERIKGMFRKTDKVEENKESATSDLLHLEPIDDLLDSYLEDSLESDESAEEVPVDKKPAKLRPSPLIILGSFFDPKGRDDPNTDLHSPSSAKTVMIGAGTPILKTQNSPARTYLKQRKEQSAVSLQQMAGSLEIMEPPTVFAGSPMLSPGSLISNNSRKNSMDSRKNSFISAHALGKIAGSNSSLNLNAYLAEDHKLNIERRKESPRFKTMHEYLDR